MRPTESQAIWLDIDGVRVHSRRGELPGVNQPVAWHLTKRTLPHILYAYYVTCRKQAASHERICIMNLEDRMISVESSIKTLSKVATQQMLHNRETDEHLMILLGIAKGQEGDISAIKADISAMKA